MKAEFGCGERPAAPAVGCDVGKQVCVLVDAASSASTDVDFTLACTFHGTGLSTATTVITGEPAKLSRTADGTPKVEATPSAAQLGKLAGILASPAFATFMSESPAKEAVPHPGQTKCALEVRGPQGVSTKKYDRDDEFTGEAQKAIRDFERAVSAAVRHQDSAKHSGGSQHKVP